MIETLFRKETAMIRLSKAQFENATTYIMKQGRPLEQAICRYNFNGAPKEDILIELKKFQNVDGGFGNALEPDLRASESSALCTLFALDILVDLEVSSDELMIEKSINYLMRTYDKKDHIWRLIPETTDTSPHAPWWNQDGLDNRFGNFLANPRVHICGHLFHYQELTPQDFRNDLLKRVLAQMETLKGKVSGDKLICYLRLANCNNLPFNEKKRIHRKIREIIPASVETDSGKWDEYCLKPYWVIESPHSAFLDIIDQALNDNLDYEICNQDKDGSWKPFWSWEKTYPEYWSVAKQEWSAILTLNLIKILQKFGRIEN